VYKIDVLMGSVTERKSFFSMGGMIVSSANQEPYMPDILTTTRKCIPCRHDMLLGITAFNGSFRAVGERVYQTYSVLLQNTPNILTSGPA